MYLEELTVSGCLDMVAVAAQQEVVGVVEEVAEVKIRKLWRDLMEVEYRNVFSLSVPLRKWSNTNLSRSLF